jgi:hypothetical protein
VDRSLPCCCLQDLHRNQTHYVLLYYICFPLFLHCFRLLSVKWDLNTANLVEIIKACLLTVDVDFKLIHLSGTEILRL